MSITRRSAIRAGDKTIVGVISGVQTGPRRHAVVASRHDQLRAIRAREANRGCHRNWLFPRVKWLFAPGGQP
jgi:hypothetical protein